MEGSNIKENDDYDDELDLFEAREKLFKDIDGDQDDFSLEQEPIMEGHVSSSDEESNLFEEMHKKMLKDVLRKNDQYLDSDEFISDF